MQDKGKCYNKIYCYFDDNGKDSIEILKESFIDFLKSEENKEKGLGKTLDRINIETNK